MRNLLRPAYKYDELPDRVREKLREEYRIFTTQDAYWIDDVLYDAQQIGALLGLTWDASRLDWSLERDRGVSVQGYYEYKRGAVRAVRGYSPQDTELARIADVLQSVQRRTFYQVRAHLSGSRRGFNTSVEVDRYDDATLSERDADAVADALQDFLHWILARLEGEYEYQTADEQADEYWRDNGDWWSADGRPVEARRPRVRAKVPGPMRRRMRQTVFPWAGSTIAQICAAQEGAL